MAHKSISFSKSDYNINSTELYFCNERGTKFIYSDSKLKNIIGIANLINGEVVEVLKKRTVNNQVFFNVKFENEILGWINLENSIRLYRIPKTFGKCDFKKKLDLKFFEVEGITQELNNNLVEAKYYSFIEGNPSVFIKKIGSSRKLTPIREEDFAQLITPEEEIKINISEGENLYKDSSMKNERFVLEGDKAAKITGYFNKLNEIRVRVDNKTYWYFYEEIFTEKEDYLAFNYDFVDKIMYLKESNNILKNKNKQQENVINTVRKNISISDDLQRLFVNRYIGDTYES